MSEITVSADKWDSLPQADKDAIRSGLISAGTLAAGDTIVSGPGTVEEMGWDPIKDLCKAACDTAAAAGATWCAANTTGPALAACLAAVASARKKCKEKC